MNSKQQTQQIEDYDRVAQSIQFLSEHMHEQPSLDEMAAHVYLSKYHFQRLFKRWAGITPTQFLHYLTVEYAKVRLAQADSVLATSLEVGLSGSGRLHDHFIKFEGVTPGQYKAKGEGLTIWYGLHATAFGDCLLATTERGICALRFINHTSETPHLGSDAGSNMHSALHSGLYRSANTDAKAVLDEVSAEWAKATLQEDPSITQPLIEQIFGDRTVSSVDSSQPFHLYVRGTNFQLNVWKALLAIPSGSLVSYQNIAEAMGQPKAVRAVANAVAKNPIGYLIPCHRVISKAGRVHRYRWGEVRKKAIVGWEAAQESHLEQVG
ncbi:MAG: methylated-DNA--[protein]-cysteine S-methyltransferase [Chloroflexota bacterium]